MAETELAELVVKLRLARGLTQGQLAEYAKVKRPWLSLVETGKRKKPERDRLERLALQLHVSPGTLWAAAGYSETPLPVPPPRSPEEIALEFIAAMRSAGIMAPMSRNPAAAGYGIDPEAERLPYMPDPSARNHQFFWVEVRGTCMEPEIHEGDRAIVDPDESWRHGKIVLAIHDGEAIIKRIEQHGDGLWLIANQERPPLRVDETTSIVGVVKFAGHNL